MKTVISLVVLILSFTAQAQLCGTPSPNANDMAAMLRLDAQIKTSQARIAATGTLWVPLKIHILRKSNGTFGVDSGIDMGTINDAIAYANRVFLPSGLQFFICGTTPNYVDNDGLYLTQYSPGNPALELATVGIFNASGESANSLNIYFVPDISRKSGGYAHFPWEGDTRATSRLFINTYKGLVPKPYISYTLAHELGHTFGLFHTFQTSDDGKAEPISRATTSCIPNPGNALCCTITGDYICDTETDPYNNSLVGEATDIAVNALDNSVRSYGGVFAEKKGCSLTYKGSDNRYSPPFDNTMSYYYGAYAFEKCTHLKFTNQQNTRILAYATSKVAMVNNNLSCSPIVQTPPSINSVVAASVPSRAGIQISWQDNSNTETGYLIERASAISGPFVCIGGVDRNITAYIDDGQDFFASAYYRVRASNTQIYSNVSSFSVQPKILTDTTRFTQIYPNVIFPVVFKTFGNFSASSTFTAQLSNASGSFVSSTNIGTSTTTPISATIPLQSFPQGNYKVRVVSTSPAAIGEAVGTFNILPYSASTTYPIVELQYKIDNQALTTLAVSASNNTTTNIPVTTTGLSQGLHTFFARVKNTNGQYSLMNDKVFLVLGSGTGNKSLITQAEYFIDTPTAFGQGTPIALNTYDFAESTLDISINSLSVGVHVLYIRAKNATGLWSITHAFPFVKIPTLSSQIIGMEYFFDNDPGIGNGITVAITSGISVIQSIYTNINPLSVGVHTLSVRVKNSNNNWSFVSQKSFSVLKSPCLPVQTMTNTITSSPEMIQASNMVIATNVINAGSSLLYRAGESITLLPGFNAKSGVIFTAVISGCK